MGDFVAMFNSALGFFKEAGTFLIDIWNLFPFDLQEYIYMIFFIIFSVGFILRILGMMK